jgi:hypothetical protein
MAIIQISKIQHRTGANVDLPQLSEGELGFATDEQKLYIGNDPLLHPPANNSTTTQVEILTEVSTLQYAKLEGGANTALNLANTYPGQVMVLAADGNTWVNAGGNVLDASNTTIIPGYGVHLGDAANIKVTGGINGYVLQTDGQGNLSWTSAGIIQYQITNISKANPAVVTTSANNQITTGVPITISGIGGMTQIRTAGESGTNKFYAQRIDNTSFSLYKDTAFSIAVDSTSFTTATYDANSLVTVSFYSQGTGSPGGSNNQIQLNDGTGGFAGSANLTFSRITNQLTIGGNLVANVVTANSFRGPVTGSIGATTPNTGAFTSITATTTAAITGNVNAGNTNISGIANIVGNLNAGNIRTAGTANVGNLNIVANVTSNLTPNANVTINLGSSSQNWKDVFVGNSISLNAQSITSDGTTATIAGNLNVGNANLGNIATANYVTGTLTTGDQPNITNVGTLVDLTVRGPVDLGNVGNLTIGGITANYVLTVKSDGSGLNWLPTQQVITNPGGVDTYVQFNDNGVFGGNARLAFNKVSGLLTTLSVAGDGANLSNLTGANVTGTVGNATKAGTVTTAAQPNITSVGTLTSIAVTGNANVGNLGTPGLIVAAGNVIGANLNTTGALSVTGNANVGNIGATAGVFTSNVSGLNVSVSNLTTTNTLTVNATAIIGTINAGNISTTGNISAGANLYATGNLTVTGNAAVGNLNVGAVVAVGAISTTDNLTVTGNITSGNISTGRGTFSGNVSSGNLSTSGNLTVGANTSVSNLAITGNITGALLPSANVTYNLGSPTQRWKDLYLSGSTIYLGAAGTLSTDVNGALSISGNLSTTANVISGNSITGNLSATGNADVTGNVIAGNVYANSGTVGASKLAGSLTTAAQPNVTSVGRLTDLAVGNSTVYSTFGNGTISANSVSVAGNIYLTTTTPININGSVGVNGQVLSTTGTGVQWITLSPNSIFNGTSNVSVSSSGGNVTVSVGGTSNVAVVSSTGVNVAGTLSATSLKLPGGTVGQALISDGAGGLIFGSGKAYAVSTINNLVAGSALVFDVDYSNVTYPAGVFTLRQLGPVSFSMSDTWSSGGTSKNAYTNGVASIVNTRDITLTLTLANATFAVNTATDSIVVGSTVISGANLASLNIATNAGGTYSIPASLFAASAQTVAPSPVTISATLTTNRGQFNTSGTNLTNNPYSAFNISFSGSWTSSSVPFWNVNQSFNWNSSLTGTVNSGNVKYTQVSNPTVTGTLSSVGGTSGTSVSLDSSVSYTISTTDYVGIGANVTAGTSTVATSTTLNAATKYYPLFYKITGSSANPNFITGDSYLTKAYAVGDGANTSTTASNYLWLAVPGVSTSHTFQHVDQGFTVADTPDATYLNQTIGGYTYQVYGFTNFSAALKISVTT